MQPNAHESWRDAEILREDRNEAGEAVGIAVAADDGPAETAQMGRARQRQAVLSGAAQELAVDHKWRREKPSHEFIGAPLARITHIDERRQGGGQRAQAPVGGSGEPLWRLLAGFRGRARPRLASVASSPLWVACGALWASMPSAARPASVMARVTLARSGLLRSAASSLTRAEEHGSSRGALNRGAAAALLFSVYPNPIFAFYFTLVLLGALMSKGKLEQALGKVFGPAVEAPELRSTASLAPYARNSRTHSDEQVDQIVLSMETYGWTNPVLVDEAGGIIAGHGRVLAAQKLGWAEAPCLVARGWSDEQKATTFSAGRAMLVTMNPTRG